MPWTPRTARCQTQEKQIPSPGEPTLQISRPPQTPWPRKNLTSPKLGLMQVPLPERANGFLGRGPRASPGVASARLVQAFGLKGSIHSQMDKAKLRDWT